MLEDLLPPDASNNVGLQTAEGTVYHVRDAVLNWEVSTHNFYDLLALGSGP